MPHVIEVKKKISCALLYVPFSSGNQRDGSTYGCLSGGKEFSGFGGFSLPERVRYWPQYVYCDYNLFSMNSFSVILCVLYGRSIATVWRREQQKETQLYTTVSCITNLNLLSSSLKQRQLYTQVCFTNNIKTLIPCICKSSDTIN